MKTFGEKYNDLKEKVVKSIYHKMLGRRMFEFDEAINLTYADEEMRMLKKKRGGKLFVITSDTNNGIEGFEYFIDGMPLADLIWIEDQLPKK